MCGIFGLIVKKNSRLNSKSVHVLLNSFFEYSKVRGLESTGLAVKSNFRKEIAVLRRTESANRFVKSNEYHSFKKTYLDNLNIVEGVTILGHTRIATNGFLSVDNQPIVKSGSYGVHNGIICNVEDLWSKYPSINRSQTIDTELLFGLLKSRIDLNSSQDVLNGSIKETFNELEGTVSFGLTFDNYHSTLIGSNCGSLYYYLDPDFIAFASEEYILKKVLLGLKEIRILPSKITQLEPVSFGLIHETTLQFSTFKITDSSSEKLLKSEFIYKGVDVSQEKPKLPFMNMLPDELLKSHLENNINCISKIRRCTRCILPKTHPFINFDESGVCNFCRDFDKRKRRRPQGLEALEFQISEIRKKSGVNSIVMLSGGRDSCYGLHVAKKELGLNPIAFSYDWGMLTDLGRRNQARMCAKLGVEHIIVSADIKMKRKYVKMNVEAFLHKPNLGTIGLFMAGDKAYHHFAKELQDRLGLPLISGGSPLEWTYFKEGFSGIKPTFMKRTFFDRFQLVKFFVLESLRNKKYFNSSIFDNVLAYKYYYLDVLDPINLFHYLPWDEDVVNNTLINEYNWEVSPDTTTTWRIGDGTASFYNYIYYTVAGFTENDCFRSNQVLEGIISREEALKRANIENMPRFESLKWYFDTIEIDMEYAIKAINQIPKLY